MGFFSFRKLGIFGYFFRRPALARTVVRFSRFSFRGLGIARRWNRTAIATGSSTHTRGSHASNSRGEYSWSTRGSSTSGSRRNVPSRSSGSGAKRSSRSTKSKQRGSGWFGRGRHSRMEGRLGAEQLETRKVLATSATLAPTAPPLVIASGVNAAEELAGFTISVPFGTSGAVAGDVLSLASGGTILGTVALQAADISNNFYDFPIVTGQLGADGTKSVTAEITSGFVSPALTFLLDTTKPTVAVASSTQSLGIGQTAIITFTLSEASTSFGSADLRGTPANVSATGGTLDNFVQVSPTIYTAVFTPDPASIAPGTVSVAGFTFADTAGNGNVSGGLSTPITIDTVAPTVAIASSPSSLGGSQTATITFALSKPSSNFTATAVVVTGGTLSGFAGSGTGYTAIFTPAANSTADGTISVPAGAFTDSLGNANAVGTLATPITVNTVAPTVTVTSDKASIGGSQAAAITFVLSKTSATFTSSDVTVTGGTLSAFAQDLVGDPSGKIYTATFTPNASFTGAATVTVNAGVFTDADGNQNTSGATSIAVNTVAPTVTVTSNASSLASGQTALITFTLSAASTTFASDDVTYSGGTITSFSLVSPTVYTAIFTPDAGATAPGSVSVAAGSFTDAAGNDNLPGGLATPITIDTVAPTVVINSSPSSLGGSQTATITFTLNKPSTTFTDTDVVVTGGTLSGFAGSGTGYTAIFTPAANSIADGTISVPAGAFTDAIGNANTVGTLAPQITVDTVAPTVTVTSDNASVGGSQSAAITFVLSKTSATFTSSDVTVTGGTLSAFAQDLVGDPSGKTYTATFTPNASFTGPATVTVNAGVFTDALGNLNTAGATSIAVNTVAPTVTVTSNASTLGIGQTALIIFTLSAASTTFASDDVTYSGGTITSFSLVSPTVYTAIFTPDAGATAPGSVSVAAGSFTDAAGNDNLPGGLATPITIDTVAPTVVINSSPSSLGGSQTATITFTLDKPSTTFAIGDINVSGGTIGNFVQSSPLVYTATFTPAANSTANGTITVPAGVFTDAIGNANAASLTTTITVDTVAPTVTVTSSVANVGGSQTATITFTLSKASTNFATGDVAVTGGTLSAISGSGTSYTATFTPTASFTGAATVTVNAGVFTDALGNVNTSGATSIAVNTVAPTVTVTSNASTLGIGQTAVITFTLSAASTTFTASDLAGGAPNVTANGGTLGNFVQVSPTVYTAIFTPANGVNTTGTVLVAANSFTDAAGNDNLPGGLVTPITIDTVAPTVASIAATPSTVGGSQTSIITFTLSKASTTFGASDVVVTGGTLSGFAGSGTGYTAIFTPAASSTANGTIFVPAGVFTDAAGNTNTASSTTNITVDTVAPTVTVTSDKASIGGSQFATITFTLSKASTTFTSSDVTVTGGTLAAISGSGTSYTATFTPTASFTGAATVTVNAGVFTDTAGNLNTSGATSIAVNTVAPTVTVTSNAASLAVGQIAVITFTLSAASTTFASGDVNATGGTLGNFVQVSPTVYTAVFTPAASSTTPGSVSVAAASFTDAAGNDNLPGGLVTPIMIDTVAPTVTSIAATPSTVGGSQTSIITFTLSKASTTFGASDVVVTGGTLSGFAGSGTGYTAIFTPTANSTASGTITVPAGVFTDAVGNTNTVGTLTPQITVDTVAPTVTVTSSVASVGGSQTATITFTLSEASTNFATGDVAVTGGSLSAISGSGTSYTATFTPTASFTGAATVTVNAGVFTDTAGNPNTAGATSIAVNTVAPTVTVTSNAASLAVGQIAVITFTLSAASTTFAVDDATATGGAIGNFVQVSPTVYTAVFTPAASSTTPGSVSVAAASFTDATGNDNLPGGLATPITIDTVAPAVAIASSLSSLGGSQTATITFTLTKSSTTFTATDVVVTGGTLSGFAGSGTGYTAIFTPAASSTADGTITVPAGAFTDAVGNTNTVGTLATPITVDTVAPTVTVTSSVASVSGSQTAAITFTLSKASTTFTTGDVTVTGGSLSAISGSGTSYTATFTPTASFTGAATVTVNAGVFTDAAGNPNTAGATSIAVNTVAPTVTVTSNATTLASGQTAVITFTLSAASSNFVAADIGAGITATGGTLSSFNPVSPTVYTAIFTPAVSSTAPGLISVAANSFTDAAGNDNLAGGLATLISIDTVAPTVTIASSLASLGGSQTSTITFTLTKSSSTFTATDVLVTGGTLSGFAGSGVSYSAIFTPAANSTANGTISVPAGAFTDAVGNPNTVGTLASPITVDTVAPTVTVTSSVASVSGSQTATITFTLSKASTNFAAGDVTVTGGTLSPLSGSGTSYTATFTPTASFTGAATVTVNAGVFTDAAGNPNTSGATSIAVNTVAPTVTVTSNAATLASGQTAVITFTLSAASTTFAVGDATAVGGLLSSFNSVSPTVYTAIFTPTASSTAPGLISVAASSFADAAGNDNLAGGLATPITIDTVAPTVLSIIAAPTSVGGSQTSTITFTLSEPSTNFALADINAGGGTIGNFVQASPLVYTATFTPAANSTANGTISVPAGVFTDSVGNTNTASSTTTITVDTVAPTVTVASSVASVSGSQTATITFTLSEASTNFTASDVTVTGGTLSPLSGSGTSYTATFTPTASFTGAATVTVNAGVFTDAAGNQNTSGATSIAVNTVAPTVTVTSNAATLASGQTALITFTLSAASTTFTSADFFFSGGSISGFTQASPTVYTAIFTPDAGSTAPGSVSVPAATFTDAAGNNNLAGGLATPITIDTIPPVVTIVATPTAVGGADTSTITFTLSKPSTTFAGSDVLVTGGTLSGFAGGGVSYSATFTPLANSIIPGNLSVPAGAFTDAIGNGNTASSITAITVDTLAPAQPVITAVISSLPLAAGTVPAGGTTNDQTLQLTGTAEPSSTVNIFINGTQVATTTTSGAGSWTYTTTTLAVASYSFSVTATDAFLNTSVSSAPAYTVTIDVTAPTITNVTVPTGIYRTGSIVPFTVTFSEPILVTTGVPELSILVGTGTAAVPRVAKFISGGDTNTLLFAYPVTAADTNDVDGIDLAGINLNGSLMFDAAGNAADLGLPVVTINNDVFLMPQAVDILGVTLQANSAHPSGTGFTADPRATPVSYFTITFNVPVPIFSSNATLDGVLDLSDFELTRDGGIIANVPFGSPTGVAFSAQTHITPELGTNYERFIITDLAGITEAVGTYILTFSDLQIAQETDITWIKTIPTPGQLTATLAVSPGASGLRNDPVDSVTVTFSEIALNVTLDDFTFTKNGNVVTWPASGVTIDRVDDGRTYAIRGLKDLQTTEGVYRVEVKPGSATNIKQLAGGQLITSAAAAWDYNRRPIVDSVALTTPLGIRTVGQTIEFDVIFDEPVFVIGQPNLQLLIGGTSKPATYVSGNATNTLHFSYSVAAGDEDRDGITFVSPIITLAGGTIKDAAGNDARLEFLAPPTSGVLVDGVAPIASSVTPPTPGVYSNDDTLLFAVNFNDVVNVETGSGTPSLPITIGGVTRPATYSSGTGTNTIVFSYLIANGDYASGLAGSVTVGSQMSLNGGSIRDTNGNDASLAVPATTISNVVINRLTATVAASATKTYKIGDIIELTATFVQPVNVVGAASIQATIGTATGTRLATFSYVSGSGSTALKFRAAVVANDLDTDGIDVNGTFILGAGISIRDLAGNDVAASFAPPITTSVLVDGVAPVASSVTPPTPGVYSTSGELSFAVTFNDVVNVATGSGNPSLPITIGGIARQATYSSGTGTSTVVFSYAIDGGDYASGLAGSVTVGSLMSLNGGSIRDTNGNDASLAVPATTVSNVLINRLAATVTASSDKNYKLGDVIELTASFTQPVNVVGAASIQATIGTATGTRLATFSYVSGSGTTALKFRAAVVANDLDTDGIDVNGTFVLGAGITIKDLAGNDVVLAFTPPNTSGIRVDGVAPVASSITQPVTGIYKTGDLLAFAVNFNDVVNVATGSGNPSLPITIGGITRQATYSSGTGTSTIVFTYSIANGDSATGLAGSVTIGSTIALNGGTIRDTNGNDASLAVPATTVSNVLINRLAATVTASADKTYKLGDNIELTAIFPQPVNVVGAASIQATIGTATGTRLATFSYVSGSGTTALKFRASVVANDLDTDGIDVNGTFVLGAGITIKDLAGNDVILAFIPPNTSGIRVDGVAPQTLGTIAGPIAGSYQTGDKLTFTVPFNDTVFVTATPTLAFTIGGITRQAAYTAGTGTATLTFEYTVVAVDAATNVVLAANTISTSGGAIKDAAGNDATLLSAANTFNGVNVNRVYVDSVAIASGPSRLYKLGESLDFAVTFNRPVTVVGTPQIAFSIGGSPAVATYLNGSGTMVVTFRHVVTNTENDADGIDMTTSSIQLPAGASIVNLSGNAADLTFVPPATVGVTIDGVAPTISPTGVTFPFAGTYKAGDTLTFSFEMSEPVTVAGSPTLFLTVGGLPRTAVFRAPGSFPTNTLSFDYTVSSADIGPANVAVGALQLNGATVRDAAGNNASLAFTAPSTAALFVDGTPPTVVSVSAIRDGLYATGGIIQILVTFSEPVVVQGLPPQLRLNSLANPAVRNAQYAAGSGTNTLSFKYVVQDGDSSPDLDVFDSNSLTTLGGTITDIAGNAANLTLAVPGSVNSLGFLNDVVVDTLPPSVLRFTSNTADGIYNAAKQIRIVATLSEPIAAGLTFDATLDTSAIVRLTTNGTNTATGIYTVATGDNSPDLTVVALSGGTLLDTALNPLVLTLPDAPNNLADTKTIVVDTVAPTVTIVSSKTALKIGETATITFTLSEPSTNFTTADVTVSGGTISPLTGAGTAYTATFTPAANSTTPGAISVAANAFTDAATNGNQAATLAAPIVIDTVAPTVVITSDRSVLKAGETATITFTLSENSSTFADGDVSVTGGTLSSFSGTGSVYTAVFTPATTSTAPGQISVAAGMFTDIAGNSNDASLVTTLSIDTVVPAVVITSDKAKLRVGQTATITFTLTENSTTFTENSVTYAGGTLSEFGGAGTVYTAIFTPTAQSTTPGSVVVNANAFTDAAGNGNTIGMLTPALIINTLVPKVTVTSNVPALKAGEKATISFTLSVSTNEFTDSDITTVGGTLSPLSGSGDSYSAEFTPAANSTSPGQISVAANVFTDADGNANAAGQLAVPLSIDTQPPTVLSITTSKSSLKIGETATITFTLSENSSTFADGDVSVTGGTLSSLSGTGSVFTAVFTPAANFEGSGTLSVAANAFTDAAGNGNAALSLPLFIAIDTIAPTIAISSSKSALKIGETATITFTLSESSTDFIPNDVTVTGGTISAWSGSGRVYTATFTPAANSTTPGAISVAANAFTDAAGNGNTAGALSPTITIDTVAPTVAITSSKTALKIGETATITFTLSEPSTNFAEADVTYSGGTLSGFAGAGTAYTATFTPTASSMTAGSISVAADSFNDGIGNGNVAGALAAPISIDTIAPTITITSSQSALKIGDTAILTFTLSEVSTDFTTAAVTVSGGTISPLTGSGTVYSATFTPTGNSTAAGVISVAVNSFKDAAGNGNTAGALSPSITIDTVAPTVAISTSKASLKSGETATITFTLSEVSTDFTTADVIVSGGTISPLTGSGTVYSATFTPTANSTAPGAISVAVNSFKDAAGNGNTAGALSPSISIDTVAPTVTISTGKASLKSGETATITFTLSEPSNTFTLASIAATGGTLSDLVGSGASYTATFTPTDNSTTAGTISVATDTFTDVAGNRNVGGSLPTPITIDTAPPVVMSFTSTAADGVYAAGAVIPIVANLSEPVRAGGTISVLLNTGASVTLTALSEGTTLTGTYTVSPGDATLDLNASSYALTGYGVVDLAGNAITNPAIPGPAGQLATLKNISIDASIKVSSGVGFSTNARVVADKRVAVTAIPITFSAPVSGVTLSAFRLYFNGRSVSLRGASVTGSGARYVLRLPARATSVKGLYTLQILTTTDIRAIANGAPMTQTLQIYWGNGRSIGMIPAVRKR
jgi:glutamine amidotransferase-like uncharacterized protein